jgi:hypothetical protein
MKRSDQRCLKVTDFERVQTLFGTPFTMDAFASDDGSNALCQRYCSPGKSFFDVKTLAGETVWINAPFNKLGAALRHYLALKVQSPQSTGGCFLVPRWPHAPPAWGTLLQGMQRLASFPAGYPLFEMISKDATRVPMRGIPWPVDVYCDTPYELHRVAGAVKDGEGPLTMTFKGTVNGVPGVIAMDTQASHCFVSSAFVQEHGICRTPIHRMVQLADGSQAQLHAKCTLYLRMPAKKTGTHYVHKLDCLEVDMGPGFDVILGDDWLQKEKVALRFDTKECVLHRAGMQLVPLCRSRTPRATTSPADAGAVHAAHSHSHEELPLLSALQARKILYDSYQKREPVRWCMVSVVDDNCTGHVPAVQQPAPDATTATQKKQVLAAIPSHVSNDTRALLEQYWHVFTEREGLPPDRGIAHLIPEVPGSQPVYRPPYRLSPLEVAEVEKQVKDLLLKGLIEPSNSPYGAPILFVGKKDGSLRMCCD